MKMALLVAAALLTVTAVLHSYLGERYILIRLFRREDLPRTFGSDWFTKRTLRFAWHLTSLAWLGFGGLLAILARAEQPSPPFLLEVIAVTFAVHAAVTGLATRGKHLAWLGFGLVAVLVWSSR